jgi:hypothetical protein
MHLNSSVPPILRLLRIAFVAASGIASEHVLEPGHPSAKGTGPAAPPALPPQRGAGQPVGAPQPFRAATG